MIDYRLVQRCKKIAQGIAPIDTGNLRYNAISGIKWNNNEFSIRYSSRDAYYIGYVEEGTEKQKAQRFIFKTYLTLAEYLNDYFNSKPKSYAKYIRNATKYEKDNFRRQLVHKNSIDYTDLMSEIRKNPHT